MQENYTNAEIMDIQMTTIFLMMVFIVWIMFALIEAIKYYKKADSDMHYYYKHEEDMSDIGIINLLENASLNYKKTILTIATLLVPVIIMAGMFLFNMIILYN